MFELQTMAGQVARWAGIVALGARLHTAPLLTLQMLVVNPREQTTRGLGTGGIYMGGLASWRRGDDSSVLRTGLQPPKESFWWEV